MRSPVRPAARPPRLPSLVVALALAGTAAACAGPAPSPVPATATPSGGAVTAAPPTPVLTEMPPPTVVPVASGDPPEPTPMPGGGTTETEWGTILDVVPDGFPVFPAARPAEGLAEPASGWLLAGADVDTVAAWYRDTLEERGFGIDDLSSPLEDGSRVLDMRTDLPECRIQMVFRPGEGSTIIKVLYGAGCAGGDG